ncbi:MAG: cytochrome c-type biogenesis protein [Acidimicrobiia bacterium]
MTRALSWAGIVLLVVVALLIGTRTDGQPPAPDARADRIAAELRCPVCQGLSVRDSDSPTARSIRNDIRQRIDDGEADEEIRQAYVERYGEWVLLRPAAGGFGALVWAIPAAGTVAAAGGLAFALRRWRRRRGMRPTSGDRLLVEQALGHELRR